MKFVIGIDEVGRGPLAGPVSIGIAVVPVSFDFQIFGRLTDSKQMTAKARERASLKALELKSEGALAFGIFSTSPQQVDEWGIERAVSSAILRGLSELAPSPVGIKIYLDGRLSAPKEYEQQTVIRGDEKIPVISLASVVAKVHRDTYMTEVIHPQFPQTPFE